MSTFIEGDCSLCGEPVTIVDGVWPPGHGFGKCAPQRTPDPGVVRGETIEIQIADLFNTEESMGTPGETASGAGEVPDRHESIVWFLCCIYQTPRLE